MSRRPGAPIVARVLFAALLAATTVALLLPADQLTTRGPDDKVGHVLTFGALAVAGLAARLRPRRLLLGLLAYAAGTEVLQAVLPVDRQGDVLDLAADAVGILAGTAAGLALARLVSWRRTGVAQSGSTR